MFNHLLNQNQSNRNRWVVSYADFVTMLLALFMVMYALSQMDVNNLKEFSKSLGNVFNLPPKENLQSIFKTTQMSLSYSKTETELKQDINELANIKTNVKEKLNNIKGVKIAEETRGLVIRLSNGVLFDPGSDIIKRDSVGLLDRIAESLKDVPNSIRIEGHTDNTPIKTAQFPSNWELSTSRATNILRYLSEKHQITPNKLSAIGYGEYMPISGNTTEQEKATNRRVDIVILSSSYKME